MTTWRRNRDKLYRGDDKGGVSLPSPSGDPSIVRHILYLDGAGRRTPYHSTSESREIAQHFAGGKGKVYATRANLAVEHDVRHVSRLELLDLLKGKGKGSAVWNSALEVMMARKYVEQHSEHLLDYQAQGDFEDGQLRELVDKLFSVD